VGRRSRGRDQEGSINTTIEASGAGAAKEENRAERIERLALEIIAPKPPGDHDHVAEFKVNAYNSLRSILYPDEVKTDGEGKD